VQTQAVPELNGQSQEMLLLAAKQLARKAGLEPGCHCKHALKTLLTCEVQQLTEPLAQLLS
jgi:hypothetical protein